MVNKSSNNRSVRKTKKILTNNLITLLKKKPINQISVKELTDLCDLNRGTFYLHYKDIYDMIECLENEIIEDLHKILNDCKLNRPLDLLVPLFSYIYENRDLTMVLIGEHGDISFSSKLIEIVKIYCFDTWKKEFKINDDEIYEIYFKFITSGFLGVCDMWHNSSFNIQPHKLAILVDEIISSGILNKNNSIHS